MGNEDNGVRQDGDALVAIAEEIENAADNFNKAKQAIFDEMDLRLGATEDENKAWWGPLSKVFLDNFNKKEEDFNTAYKNIASMAQNLNEQAEAWSAFEEG